jgi:protein-L-isoaspartate(D-aspartate) O-methyltransferase
VSESRLALLLAALFASQAATAAPPDFEAARDRMVQTIETLAKGVQLPSGRQEIDASILAAMRKVPRHELVPEGVRSEAYEDRPLPIGHGQTISQPYIVALMTQLARPAKHHVVLEVGTGSGYQAAVLSPLVAQVYSIEIVEPLARQAGDRLRALGFENVSVRHGDGYKGWPEHGPFDSIVVTAGASHVPEPLVEQLKPGGRMVIPVGGAAAVQYLTLIEKDEAGRVHTRSLLPVRFVPLTGENTR